MTNLQGDVIALMDRTGAVVVEYSYDAWGNILNITGSLAATLGEYNPLRYRGYVYDTETTFYYLQSRYYDPEMGRFISGDTFTSTGGLMGNNMMAYCLNNPANFFDNRGTDAIWIQEKERGGGYGHSGLLVDDGEGNWYFLYWGSAGSYSTVDMALGTPYEFVFVQVDVTEYDLYSIDGVIDALSNSGNKTAQMRSQYVTGTYYFEGDYSATYDYLSEMAERNESKSGSLGKYYLLQKNCAQVTWAALAQSNIRLHDNSCPYIPNLAFEQVQFLDGMSNCLYGAFRMTMAQ